MKRLNKKGFTLVELLAVIVVLAIIMVIATQAIGNVIKENTAKSFKSSLDMVAKQAKQAYVMDDGTKTLGTVKSYVDYDPAQYSITFGTSANAAAASITDSSLVSSYNWICLVAPATGSKFSNMNNTALTDVFGAGKFALTSGKTTACKKFTN